MKIQMEQVDLLAPWPAITMRDGYHAVRVLVRIGLVPIGDVFLRPARGRVVTHKRLRRRIARKYAEKILKTLAAEATGDINDILLPTGAPEALREAFMASHGQQSWPMPRVTVAVYTCGREDLVAACVGNLKRLDYPNFDILILDNGNDPVPTREVAEKLGVGYLRCLARGPGRPRNAAIEHARTEWVAFIDDDCRPERTWLKELVRPTQIKSCRCVCGLVQPDRLESSADIAFEMHRGLAQRFDEITLTPDSITASATHPAPVWRFGSASNLLVHKSFVRLAGGFDPHLPDGEEAGLLYRALLDEYTVHYTPRAIVHHHRTWTPRTLRKHVRTAGTAAASFHMQRLFRHADLRSLLELAWRRPKSLACELIRAMRGKSKYPWPLLLVELHAAVTGPGRYVIDNVHRAFKSRRATPQTTQRRVPNQPAPGPTADSSTVVAVHSRPRNPRNPSHRAA